MKCHDIINVLIDFEKLNYKAILFNGKWGIGKTYQVKKYVKDFESRKKNIKKITDDKSKYEFYSNVYYISVFGFKSIDEIHTNLFDQIHPIRSKLKKYGSTALKATGIISKAVSLIPNSGQLVSDIIGNSLELAADKFDENCNDNNGFKKNYDNIIIFDDLERTSINYLELLGYFNQLFFQGFRLVCLCDKDRIEEKNKKYFDEFKEKIFDRIYSIQMADKEIINSYFPDRILDEDVYNIFNDNLRLASKASVFFNEIINKINNLKKEKTISLINYDSLLFYCSLVVCGFNNVESIMSMNYKPDDTFVDSTESEIEYCGLYGYEASVLKKIIAYENSLLSDLKIYPCTPLLIALTKIYIFNDYYYFNNYFIKIDQINDIFDTNLFLLSEKSKKRTIKIILNKLLENNLKIDDRVLKCFVSIQQYKSLFPSDYSDEKYVEIFAKEIVNNISLEKYLKILFVTKNDAIFSILAKIKDKVIEMKKIELLKNLNKLCKTDDIEDLEKIFFYIRTNDFCKVYKERVDLIPEILYFFQKNNWLLNDMRLDMTNEKWEWNIKILCFALDFKNMHDSLEKYLRTRLETSNNTSEKEKIVELCKNFI